MAEFKSYRDYIEYEILSGKSHQEVYNNAVAKYDVKIHDIAEALRKTPSIEKRTRSKKLNDLLMFLLVMNVGLGIISRLEDATFAALAPSVIIAILFYGIYNFKYPAHLIVSILLTVLTAVSCSMLFFDFSWIFLTQFIITLAATIISFKISATINSDYTFNKEMLKNDPEARENVITFDA